MFTYTLCVHIYSVNRVLRGDVPKINKGARVDVSDLPAEILFCGSIYFSITHLYDFFFVEQTGYQPVKYKITTRHHNHTNKNMHNQSDKFLIVIFYATSPRKNH
uniref:GH23730p n=1 Tax=Drosophila melanogaster TaxID=7227 RepID=Q95SI5_DROME|nr:GH23730p [Drosophila melanogaster]